MKTNNQILADDRDFPKERMTGAWPISYDKAHGLAIRKKLDRINRLLFALWLLGVALVLQGLVRS